MDKETLKNKEWLDEQFAVKDGRYVAHQPIYGYKKGLTGGRDLIRYFRNLSILNKISRFNFDNFIDIGGAEGYMANLVKKIFNVDSYTCDLSYEADLRARELFGLDSVGIDLSNLPFRDEAFDITLCSEVLEHVTNPVRAICELKRITKKALIITTEGICHDALERKLRMLLVDLNEYHTDRNWFLVDDFKLLLGENIIYENSVSDIDLAAKKGLSLDEVRGILKKYDEDELFTREGLGVLILLNKKEPDRIQHKESISAMADTILGTTVNPACLKDRNEKKLYFNDRLLGLMQCPECGESLRKNDDRLICSSCNRQYEIRQGIPLMYAGEGDTKFLTKRRDAVCEDVKKLAKTFTHTCIKPGLLIRLIVPRILKVKKFIYNTNRIMEKDGLGQLPLYLLDKARKKIYKEITRPIKKIRKIRMSDFYLNALVEFVKDYNIPSSGEVFVKKGSYGRLVDISDDHISIKVEGIDTPIYLWSYRSDKGPDKIDYVKIMQE